MRSDDLFPKPLESPAVWDEWVRAHPAWLPATQAGALQQRLIDEVKKVLR
jgi:hypothetical protein